MEIVEVIIIGKEGEKDLFISERQLEFLKRKGKYIMDEFSRMEMNLQNSKDVELQSCVKSLKVLLGKFFDKLGKLGDYSEYVENKDIFDMYKNIKGDIGLFECEKKKIEVGISKSKKEQEKILKEAQKKRKLSALDVDKMEMIDQSIGEAEDEKEYLKEQKKWQIKIAEELLLSLFGLEWKHGESNRRIKESERFVKKYEYDFRQLQKYLEQMEILWSKIMLRVNELENKVQDVRERRLDSGFTSINDIEVKKNIPEELKNLFDQLEENCVNNDRLSAILQKIYNGDRIIKSQYIDFWISVYSLSIDSNKLKSILEKVFIIKEKEENGGDCVLEGETNDKESSPKNESEILDEKKQDSEMLQNIYDKLKNGEVSSEEFYSCFLNILKKYLCLTVDDETKLVKQFKCFETTNYFYEYVLSEGKKVIKGDSSSLVCLRFGTKKGYCVYKFLKGDSGARILIDNDKKIVMVCDHATYIKYCGLTSRKR